MLEQQFAEFGRSCEKGDDDPHATMTIFTMRVATERAPTRRRNARFAGETVSKYAPRRRRRLLSAASTRIGVVTWCTKSKIKMSLHQSRILMTSVRHEMMLRARLRLL